MRYMVIKAGVAVNAIGVSDPDQFPHMELVASETARIGDLWDGTAFTAPPVDPDAAAAEALHLADAQARGAAKADGVVQFLRDHTPAECEDYVQTNVTDLATARANKICANNPEVVSRYAIVAEIEQILAAETAAFQRGEFLAGLSLHVIRQRLTTLTGPEL